MMHSFFRCLACVWMHISFLVDLYFLLRFPLRIVSGVSSSSSSHACSLSLSLAPPCRFAILLLPGVQPEVTAAFIIHLPFFLNSKPLKNKVCVHVPSGVPLCHIRVLPLVLTDVPAVTMETDSYHTQPFGRGVWLCMKECSCNTVL